MTANAAANDRLACRKAGVNDHVGKLVDSEVFHAALLHWLQPAATS